MELIKFEEKYRQAFIDFNTDWIVSNFGFLEEHDLETFDQIDAEFQRGAMIFFAVEKDVPLACCMSKPMDQNTWEICKLGSNKDIPHKGAGSMVFKAAMDWAIQHKAKSTTSRPAAHFPRSITGYISTIAPMQLMPDMTAAGYVSLSVQVLQIII